MLTAHMLNARYHKPSWWGVKPVPLCIECMRSSKVGPAAECPAKCSKVIVSTCQVSKAAVECQKVCRKDSPDPKSTASG